MKLLGNDLLLKLLVLLYPINYIAYNYTNFPNQIFYLYIALFFALSLILNMNSELLKDFVPIYILFISYILCFLIVSSWELFPGVTNNHIIFQLLNILILFIFFNIGYSFSFNKIYECFVKISILYLMIFITSYLLDIKASRLGYAPIMCLFLPFLWYGKNYLVILLVGIISISSNSISIFIIYFSSTIFYLYYSYKAKLLDYRKIKPILLFGFMKFFGKKIILVSCVFLIFFYERIILTINRIFSVINDVNSGDYVRNYLNSQAFTLLQDTKFLGIGYMNFYEYAKRDPYFQSYLASVGATTNQGVNLHNSYMTWCLEGGFLVTSAITLILAYTCSNLLRINKVNKNWCAVMSASFFSLLIFGLIHQAHMTHEFWGSIALIAGLSSSLRSDAKFYNNK
jgi:hypothetical protein